MADNAKRKGAQSRGSRRAPPPADYSDEVTADQKTRLKQLVSDLNLDKWEKVSGPAC
jgi:hypothetical protein